MKPLEKLIAPNSKTRSCLGSFAAPVAKDKGGP